jgi:CPA1 family monovalent cation:H+ antiporter
VPFIAYIPAEELHGSGVISVVAAGLYCGHQSAKAFTAQSRISERFNWRTVQFVLENGVFLLMGAQISTIISDIDSNQLPIYDAVLLGLLMTVLLIVIRYAFVWPLIFVMRAQEQRFDEQETMLTRGLERMQAMVGLGSERFERRRALTERRIDRRRNDIAQLRSEGLGWRGGVVLGWAGMRGVVTLAAAQSLPRSTPYYEQLVLIAFVVAVTTLLVQGGTLPFVIRATGIRGSDRVADRRELASLLEVMSITGLALLDREEVTIDGEQVAPEVVERVRQDALLAVESAWERADHADEESLRQAPHQQYRLLRREVLNAERDVLLEARARGAYPSRIVQRAQVLLDLEEARLEQIDTGGRVEE